MRSDAEVQGRPRAGVLIAIGLCCFLVYNANLRSVSAGDTYPARYLPFAILQYHTFVFDPVAEVARQGHGDQAYWLQSRPDGRLISLYPIVTPLLVTPLYVPAVAYLRLDGWTNARLDRVAKVMEKLSASLVAALSAALLFLLLCRRVKTSVALLLTAAYAFGTTTWMIGSQALWQHGMAELLVIGALLLLTARCTWPRTLAAGLVLGLIAGNRPPDVILAAALGAHALFWAGRRRALLLAGAAALPMLLVLFYNLRAAGNIAGGYGLVGSAHFFEHGLLPGIAGLLVSPTRGILLFSPFLLFLVLAWRTLPRVREERMLTLSMTACIALQLLLYAKADWRGGFSWGPRYMTDLLPFCMWMLAPVVAALRGVARACFAVAVGVAIVIETIGAFGYTWPLDTPIFAGDRGREDMRGAWKWRNAPFVTALEQGFAPPDLAVRVRGTLDAVESAGGATATVTAGEEAFATGWALAGNGSPWQVAVTIDGRPPSATAVFFDRPDVRESLRVASPAGWSVRLDTGALAPGKHRLTAFVWSAARGERQYLDDGELTIQAPAARDPP